jgi:hypothetical protein
VLPDKNHVSGERNTYILIVFVDNDVDFWLINTVIEERLTLFDTPKLMLPLIFYQFKEIKTMK